MLTRRLWRHASARTAACDALAGDLLETLLAGLSTASCQRGESGARKSGISVQESCEGFHPKVGNNLGTTAPKHQGNRGVGPTRKQDESTTLTSRPCLQNLHPRFKSGRRLQIFLKNLEADSQARTAIGAHCAQIVPVAIFGRSVRLQPDL